MLAARTVGYLNEGESGNVVGIEGAYDQYLKGVTGVRLMQKTAGNIWIPVSDRNEVEPENGFNIVTTIDIDIQDVAENALSETVKTAQCTSWLRGTYGGGDRRGKSHS